MGYRLSGRDLVMIIPLSFPETRLPGAAVELYNYWIRTSAGWNNETIRIIIIIIAIWPCLPRCLVSFAHATHGFMK